MDKELRDRLYWLADELSEEERELLFDDVEPETEEPEFIQPPRRRGKLTRAEKQERRTLDDLYPMEDRMAPVVKKKGIVGLLLLAVLELIGIFLVIGWWLQWLI